MRILFAMLALLLCGQTATQREPRVQKVTTAEVAEAVEAKESGWDFTPGVCTCPPLVSGQKSQSVGTWRRQPEGDELEVIFMDVYEIGTAGEAAEWMKGFDRRELGAACQVEKHSLGDEAYRLDCPLNAGDTVRANISIFLRKGRYVVQVKGGAQETVERFARYALSQLPAG